MRYRTNIYYIFLRVNKRKYVSDNKYTFKEKKQIWQTSVVHLRMANVSCQKMQTAVAEYMQAFHLMQNTEIMKFIPIKS